ncbi:MAG: extracellular solute-binding protein [Aggregatilineales bacterium]
MMKKGLTRRDFLKSVGVGGASLAVASLIDLSRAYAQSGEEIVVRYLTPSWASTRDRRPERQVAFRGAIDSFNSQFASQGIRVEEIVGDGATLTITQEIEAGNVDAIWFNHGEFQSRYGAGQLVDLNQYEAQIDQFFDFVQNTVTAPDGAVAALWHNTDTPLYYYNTTKIPTAPATWSELVAICQQIREEEGGNKYGFVTPYVGWFQVNFGMYVALGGTLVDENGAPTAFTPENLDIWRIVFGHAVSLIQDDLIPASAVGNLQNQMLPDVFAGNVYSFAGNSNFHTRELLPNLPPEEYANWAAAPLPYPDEAGSGLNVAGGWGIAAVNSDNAAQNAAAAAWAIHATNQSAMANTCLAGGWIPTRPEILSADPFYSEDAFAQVTLQALESGWVVPTAPIFNEMWPAFDVAIQRAATGEVSIDEALSEAEAEINRAYEALQSS